MTVIICIAILVIRLYRKKTAQLKALQLENRNLTSYVNELVTIPTESATNQAYGVTSDLFSRTQDEPLYSAIEETANGGVSESDHVSRPGDVDYSYVKTGEINHNVGIVICMEPNEAYTVSSSHEESDTSDYI